MFGVPVHGLRWLTEPEKVEGLESLFRSLVLRMAALRRSEDSRGLTSVSGGGNGGGAGGYKPQSVRARVR